MIRLDSIEIAGVATTGEFVGAISFSEGLQVVSAHNAFGKSLAVTAIAWCVGGEAVFGIPDNDSSCFPAAVRDEIDLGQSESASVVSSICSLRFTHSDKRSLRLSRAIKGDCTTIEVSEVDTNGTERISLLSARNLTMQDEHGGFQRFLYDLLGWPRERVTTYRGNEADVYFENLLPLFYIDQDEGWTDIQALQITRYGQQQIGEIAIEYLLGGVDAVAARVERLRATQTNAALKESARVLCERIVTTRIRFGWRTTWSSQGSTADVAKRWSAEKLADMLLREFEVDLPKEIVALRSRATKLREALTGTPIDAGDASAPAAASQKVIGLKERRHRLSEDLNTSRRQQEQNELLLGGLEDRIQAASDLLRLKTTGIGRIDHLECPTCHRDLDPATFALNSQSADSVARHIESLKRDRDLLRRNISSIEASLGKLTAELTAVSTEFLEAERALLTVTASIGTVREQLAKTAADLAAVERSIDRAQSVEAEIIELQKNLDSWVQAASRLEVVGIAPLDFERRRSQFLVSLRKYLLAFGHSAVTVDNTSSVNFDEQYTPMLGHRRLRSLGSASDQSRLIASHALALAEASGNVNGLHPGIVILDEPLQQNPDTQHRSLFLNFLAKDLAKTTAFQTLVFTSLSDVEISFLRAEGVKVLTPPGQHFLAPVVKKEETPEVQLNPSL